MTIMTQSDKRNQNVKMAKELRSLINTYHFTNEKKEHTHTFFGENRIEEIERASGSPRRILPVLCFLL